MNWVTIKRANWLSLPSALPSLTTLGLTVCVTLSHFAASRAVGTGLGGGGGGYTWDEAQASRINVYFTACENHVHQCCVIQDQCVFYCLWEPRSSMLCYPGSMCILLLVRTMFINAVLSRINVYFTACENHVHQCCVIQDQCVFYCLWEPRSSMLCYPGSMCILLLVRTTFIKAVSSSIHSENHIHQSCVFLNTFWEPHSSKLWLFLDKFWESQ